MDKISALDVPSMGEAALKHGIVLSCCAEAGYLKDDKDSPLFRLHYRGIGDETAGYLPFWQPQFKQYYFDNLDYMWTWCAYENMTTSYFHLFWGAVYGIPDWLKGLSKPEVEGVARSVVSTITGRYKIDYCIVTNENPGLWDKKISDFYNKVYSWAVTPINRVYNHFNISTDQQNRALQLMHKGLLENFGFQCHLTTEDQYANPNSKFWLKLANFASALGIDNAAMSRLILTEVDVCLGSSKSEEQEMAIQAQVYHNIFEFALKFRIPFMGFWGNDRRSWKGEHKPGVFGWEHDIGLQWAKPAYYEIMKVLNT